MIDVYMEILFAVGMTLAVLGLGVCLLASVCVIYFLGRALLKDLSETNKTPPDTEAKGQP